MATVTWQGDAQAVERLVAAMRDGPPRASVTRIERREVEPQGLDSFERR